MFPTCNPPQLDEARCTRCGACLPACPCGAITMGERGPVFACLTTCRRSRDCVAIARCCWPCEDACPAGAIQCAFEIVVKP